METVLVTYATRRGSTGEVGLAIGELFTRAGYRVDVRPCSRARAPQGYRAVVVGSAVYAGVWEPSALDYLSRYAAELTHRPTWLYSRVAPGEPDPTAAGGELLDRFSSEAPVRFSGPLGPWGSSRSRWRETSSGDAHMSEWGRIRDWATARADSLGALVGV